MNKNNTSFNSRMGISPSEVFLKIFLKVVFWANVLNAQWKINNSKAHELILKINSRITPNWILDPVHASQIGWAHIKKSISNAHFVVIPSRRCQNVGNVHETFANTIISFLKRTFLDHREQNVPQISSETSLPRLVQNKPSVLIRREENKVEFLEK